MQYRVRLQINTKDLPLVAEHATDVTVSSRDGISVCHVILDAEAWKKMSKVGELHAYLVEVFYRFTVPLSELEHFFRFLQLKGATQTWVTFGQEEVIIHALFVNPKDSLEDDLVDEYPEFYEGSVK